MPGGWVYIMTNHPSGTLYVGVASDLPRRIGEHRQGLGSQFVRRYYLKRLVYAEHHDDIIVAIHRETSIKRWPRAWKVNLIVATNPEWNDLYDQLN
jgi:putative endonuclease